MQNEDQLVEKNEISMIDIRHFIRRNKWRIVFGGAAGMLLATAFVLITPNRYEVSLQLQMAQFGSGNGEEPAALTQRLRMPTAYSVDTQQSCGVQVDGDTKDYLNGIVKMDTVKTVPNLIEMKVRGPSPVQAKQCAEAIFSMIVAQQHGLIEDRLAGRQVQLAQYQQALQAEQQQLKTIKQTELGNISYLTKLDKLSWLRTRIDALQEEAFLSQMHPAKLISPPYVPSKPVSPRVGMLLALGILLGLMLGVLYAVGRDGWRKAA
jgi:LPS O-antigen subunit length determinant protein (WzzB/FepE family)